MSDLKSKHSNTKASKSAGKNGSGGATGTIIGGTLAGIASVALLPVVPPQVHLMVIGAGAKLGNDIEKTIRGSLSQRK